MARKEEEEKPKAAADMTLEEQNKALAIMIKQIEKREKAPGLIRQGDSNLVVPVDVISTGSLGVDIATGIGGLPRGRIVEIYGPESSGKTTLALHTIAETQKRGGRAGFIDAEHALDLGYARKLGVKVEELIFMQPDSGEQALEVVEDFVRSGLFRSIFVDSVAGLVPRSELEGDMGDATMGAQARLMSQAMRKLAAVVRKTNTLVVFLNQIRMKIGQMFGNPETTTGGGALKYWASMRLDIRRSGGNSGQLKGKNEQGEDEIQGNETKVRIVKNKVGPPFREAFFDILYSKGIDTMGELVTLGERYNIISKSGAWYAYQGSNFAQGKANAVEYLRDNPVIASTVKEAVVEEAFKDIKYASLTTENDTKDYVDMSADIPANM